MLHNIERRYKICYIPENAFLNCLSLSASVPGDCLTKISLGGVPPGTIAMHRGYNHDRQKEYVVLWNATWPVVPEALLLDEIKVTTTYLQVKGTEPRREAACDQPLIRNAGTFTLERRDASGRVLETVTFENPIAVDPGQELVLVGYHNTCSEPIGEARVTGVTISHGDVSVTPIEKNGVRGFNVKGAESGRFESVLAEFMNPDLGTAHESKPEDPFMKIWKDKDNA